MIPKTTPLKKLRSQTSIVLRLGNPALDKRGCQLFLEYSVHNSLPYHLSFPPLILKYNSCLDSYQLPESFPNAPSLFWNFILCIGPIPVLLFLNVLFSQLYYTFLKYKESVFISPNSTYHRAVHIIRAKKYLLFDWTQGKQFLVMVASLYSHVAPLTI